MYFPVIPKQDLSANHGVSAFYGNRLYGVEFPRAQLHFVFSFIRRIIRSQPSLASLQIGKTG